MSNSSFTLWCVNNSNNAGNVCVYQDSGNVAATGTGTLDTLAWMVTGANPGIQIQFIWNTAYDLVWFDNDPTPSQQILPTSTGNQATLSKNSYGYLFSPTTTGTAGQLTVRTDTSIPAVNNVITGIGMDGAGTFGYPALPNVGYGFTPASTANLSYWISFGYSGKVNQSITVASMNNPQQITFPYGVTTMTATYQIDGTWSVSTGAPVNAMTTEAFATSAEDSPTQQVLVYRPGVGLS
ncbi:hypothetical protein [Paludibacterium purpuratum]|uniref:Uncharacterized protein n=1 Tax=Paludibacterium purpuratum TaxID=1144873 RepID=A0A4R7B281_9NEIS|nr:hypothetical protein [Paludibacterium purpuratum]TDR77806.1 hypothetical protein DFP86_10946 [Paludibacterium purpuratum]